MRLCEKRLYVRRLCESQLCEWVRTRFTELIYFVNTYADRLTLALIARLIKYSVPLMNAILRFVAANEQKI